MILADAKEKKARPYADAPRLPEGEHVDARDIVKGEWLELELGPGRGGFIIGRATVEPRLAILGIEIRLKWAAIVDAKLVKMGVGARARVVADDARVALARMVPDASVRRVYSHFPDPWWKKRHQKRLMLAPVIVTEIARLLEPGGELFVQTDVEERAAQYEGLFAQDDRFTPHGDAKGSARLAENPYGARSPREVRAIADSLPIFRVRFARK